MVVMETNNPVDLIWSIKWVVSAGVIMTGLSLINLWWEKNRERGS